MFSSAVAVLALDALGSFALSIVCVAMCFILQQ
jgi:hypothetical protein